MSQAQKRKRGGNPARRGVQRRREQAERITMCHVSPGSTSCGIGERFYFSVECTKSPFGLWTHVRASCWGGTYFLHNQRPPERFPFPSTGCECDCVDGDIIICGPYFDCIDPSSSCYEGPGVFDRVHADERLGADNTTSRSVFFSLLCFFFFCVFLHGCVTSCWRRSADVRYTPWLLGFVSGRSYVAAERQLPPRQRSMARQFEAR